MNDTMDKPLLPSQDPEWYLRTRREPDLVKNCYDEITGMMEEADAHQAAPTHAPDAAERDRIERDMQQFMLAFCKGLEDQLKGHGLHVMRMGQRQDHWRIWLQDREGRPYEVKIDIDEASALMVKHGEGGGQKLLDLAMRRVFEAREYYRMRMH